jgi:HD-GYP domain-containing protein (c-di-GMP phosphodiesterase class II)
MIPEQQPIQTDSVNQHYLDKVMDLAEERTVEAIEDIYDARGMKLVAKGTRISTDLQEKLILHKLHKPLESSIAVEGGITIKDVVAEAKRLAETIDPVGRILKTASGGGASPLDILGSAQIGNAMSMMLTIIERGGPTALTHSVMVSLVSVCLAKKIGLGLKDQGTAALAGLLHDIGELYIEPEYLQSKKPLRPEEWRHVVVHPRIGQMLIDELEDYPAAVGLAVAEHHERFDGSGYPRQLAGNNISIAGQVVSVAEMVSGVFMRRDRPLERAELALKIVPGEHPYGLVSAISGALRLAGHEPPATPDEAPEDSQGTVRNLFSRIASVLDEAHQLLDSSTLQSKTAKELLLQVLNRTRTIERAFSSTGLYVCMDQPARLFQEKNIEIVQEKERDCQILLEAAVATKEIQWRLRDIARNIALMSSSLDAHEFAVLQRLIGLLDENHTRP